MNERLTDNLWALLLVVIIVFGCILLTVKAYNDCRKGYNPHGNPFKRSYELIRQGKVPHEVLRPVN